METSPDKKRIAIILALDMAGFSSRTETDEQGAVASVAALRARVAAAAAAHGGRIFNTAGDGIMLENSQPPVRRCKWCSIFLRRPPRCTADPRRHARRGGGRS